MKRARVIITEINITKQGEVQHFQIKLPKNSVQIIAVETDCRINITKEKIRPKAEIVASSESEVYAVVAESTIRRDIAFEEIKGFRSFPFLKWTNSKNPTLGKLKLQSLERANIFYEEWVRFSWLNGGIDDMSYGLFPLSPFSLNKNTVPKKVDVPNTTTIINGLFTDTIGLYLKQGLTYTIKVFVWVETKEDADGVVFDFQIFNK